MDWQMFMVWQFYGSKKLAKHNKAEYFTAVVACSTYFKQNGDSEVHERLI